MEREDYGRIKTNAKENTTGEELVIVQAPYAESINPEIWEGTAVKLSEIDNPDADEYHITWVQVQDYSYSDRLARKELQLGYLETLPEKEYTKSEIENLKIEIEELKAEMQDKGLVLQDVSDLEYACDWDEPIKIEKR